MPSSKTKILVILGAGRSGTSLLMNILHDFGIKVSKNLVGANETNIKGAWEDKEILEISRQLLRHFTRNALYLSHLPMPVGWLDDSYTQNQISRLVEIVKFNTTDTNEIWGFKEPVTAKLLPMWRQVFAQANVEPVYILALRKPECVVKSFNRSYEHPNHISEQIWLSRYSDAIRNTDCDFTIITYEKWFDDPVAQAKLLLSALGTADKYNNNKLENLLGQVIDIKLNKSDNDLPALVYSESSKLYVLLENYHGDEDEKLQLLKFESEISALLAQGNVSIESVDFIGEHLRQARENIDQKRNTIEELRQRDKTKTEKNILLREKNADLRTRNSNLRGKNNTLRGKNNTLRGKNNTLRGKNNLLLGRIERKDKRIDSIIDSTSYKLGNIIVDAFTKPGSNTLLLPIRISKLIFRRLFK